MFWLLLSLRAIVFALLLTLSLNFEKGKLRPMKILNHLVAFVALICFCSRPATAQESTNQDVENPDFKIEKKKLPRSNFRHVHFAGLHPDGRLLMLCSPDKSEVEVYQPFWVSQAGDSLKMEEASDKELPSPKQLREIARYDRNTIYYTTKRKDNVNFYRAKMGKDGIPGPGQEVGMENCGKKITISNPFIFHPLTSNHPVLLFCDQVEGQKDQDIFYSELIDGVWSCPRPLLAEGVNTRLYDETHPFVDKDGILFFCSNRPHPDAPVDGKHAGKKFDLYCTTRSSQPFWGDAAANPLPLPFNTPSDEHAIVPLASSLRTGLLISDADKRGLQLYSFKSTATDTLPPPLRHYALVVGVKEYEHLTDLDSTLSECHQLARMLTEIYGFNTSTLENPTSAQLLERLTQYHNLDDNEHLLVVFMGHGLRYDPPDDDPIPRSILAGKDGKCVKWATDGITCTEAENCITPDDFVARLKLIGKPRHILVLLDVCFGGMFEPSKTRGEFDQKSRKMIASTFKEEVRDGGDFFVGLKNKLKEGPRQKEGFMTGKELFDAIFEHMARVGAPNKPAYKSFPGFDEGGEFIFPQKRN